MPPLGTYDGTEMVEATGEAAGDAAGEAAGEVAAEVQGEVVTDGTGDGTAPHRPYATWQPVPQCKSDVPHQPRLEQQ